MKKVVMGIVLLVILFSLIISYKHVQQPTNNDVFTITEKWSPSTEQIHLVREMDSKWLTIFRNQNTVFIAELQQNWLGTWKFRDENNLAAANYPPLEGHKLTWGASDSNGGESAYFGMVIDPEIEKIKVETQNDFFEDAQFINSEGNRFFLITVDQPMKMPVNISGYSKSGELMYSSLKAISRNKD